MKKMCTCPYKCSFEHSVHGHIDPQPPYLAGSYKNVHLNTVRMVTLIPSCRILLEVIKMYISTPCVWAH